MSQTIIASQSRLDHLEDHAVDQVNAFREQLLKIGPERVLIVLLDIGKNAHWAMAATGFGQELIRPHRLAATQVGFDQLTGLIERLIEERQPQVVILGHEPTGVYHEPWARALMARYQAHLDGQRPPEMRYRFFNPYQVKLARQQTHLRPRKTDPRDLAAMLDLTLRGLGQPAFLATDTELLLRQEVGFLRAQGRLLGRLERQLGQLVDQLWPGAVVNLKQFRQAHPQLPVPAPLIQSRPFERQRLQILFAHCPNPHDLLALADQAILELYRSNGGRAGPALLRDLRAWGQNAVLLPPAVAQPLAEHLQRLFGHYTRTQTLIADARQRLVPLVPLTPARHLLAIPGLGPTDAAAYLAALGSPHRFQRAAEVWAFAGFDPIPTGSGDKPDRVGQISKHGDPAFRDALFQMAYRVALHYPPFSLTFLDAFERGKSEIEATLHTAHRLNRLCFHLLRRDEPFVDHNTAAVQTEAARRWRQFRADKKRRKSRRARGKRRR